MLSLMLKIYLRHRILKQPNVMAFRIVIKNAIYKTVPVSGSFITRARLNISSRGNGTFKIILWILFLKE